MEHAAGAACPQLVRAIRRLSHGPTSRRAHRPEPLSKSVSLTEMHILESQLIATGAQNSRLKFEVESGPVGIGNRYLLIDGKRAYDLGINCQTCSLLFQRLPGANQSIEIEETAGRLRKGIGSLSDPVIQTIGGGLPEGQYFVLLGETELRLVYPQGNGDYFCEEQIALWGEDHFWCMPHNPRTPYFRTGEVDIGDSRKLFNFVVPMYPTKWLTFKPLSIYERELRENGSGTAVALSILDVRAPADWEGEQTPDPLEHWCLTHYLIDGHHKLHAASESGRPLSMLSFLAIAQSAATRDEIEKAISILRP
jgi:hypothetical protein